MKGYDDTSYGSAFADVYDDWYLGISDIEATIADLRELAGTGPVLELGVGTGRLAVPLAYHDTSDDTRDDTSRLTVIGIDSSEAMLSVLRRRDPESRIGVVHGDMVTDLPDGPFTLVFVAYNTFFNLLTGDAQAACFEAVTARLAPGGRFVIEAFVPDDPPRRGDDIAVRTLEADRVVLSISRHDPDHQSAEGQFVEISEAGGVRLRPWSIRYATPAQLDAMAARAGLTLESRSESFGQVGFHPDSARHVSVYRMP
ncbi:MAG TPA: class I SAM-dependent methyltransferase [Ilumatobacter sp.]|nr:class I SAM-dependent methyltransferase [Ilumatobacter sp.]